MYTEKKIKRIKKSPKKGGLEKMEKSPRTDLSRDEFAGNRKKQMLKKGPKTTYKNPVKNQVKKKEKRVYEVHHKGNPY